VTGDQWTEGWRAALPRINREAIAWRYTRSIHFAKETPMAAAHLLLNVEDGVAVVTLNRPEALNSINKAMRMEMLELFPALDVRKDVKVIVITGAGDKAFCTGADLKERSAKTTEQMVFERHYMTSRSSSALAGVSKPVIAAIKGYCMAGGYEMVLQCDIAIASDNAIFSLPEVTHGFDDYAAGRVGVREVRIVESRVPAFGDSHDPGRVLGLFRAKRRRASGAGLTRRQVEDADGVSLVHCANECSRAGELHVIPVRGYGKQIDRHAPSRDS
jgi:hypothetical protein